MSFEKPGPSIDDAAFSLMQYTDFVAFELREAQGAMRFQVFHPAPDNIPLEGLEMLAQTCRDAGYNACLAALEHEGQEYFGVKITS